MAIIGFKKYTFLIAIVALIGSCTFNNNSKNSDIIKPLTKDTLYALLANSVKLDSFHYQPNPLLYLRAGNLFLKDKKNAVLAFLSSKASEYGYYTLQLFTLNGDKWIKDDEVDSIECFPVQFNISYEDYNFDGCKDILVEKNSSNGLSELHQNLLTLDSITMKLTTHPEFAELANTSIDWKNKTIQSQKVVNCQPAGNRSYCDLISHWRDNEIITLKNSCPCETEDSLVSVRK